MRKIARLCFAFVAVMAAFSITSASAYFKDGNQLLDDCRAPLDTLKATICLAYIEGAADSGSLPFQYSYTLDGKQYLRPRACMSNNVIAGQAKDVVIKYLEEHPEQRELPADTIVVAALAKAFPC